MVNQDKYKERERIINDIMLQTSESLASAIREGVFEDLKDLLMECGPCIDAIKRKEIKALLEAPVAAVSAAESNEEADFAQLNASSPLEQLQHFLDTYSESKYYDQVLAWKKQLPASTPAAEVAANPDREWFELYVMSPSAEQVASFLDKYPGHLQASAYLNDLMIRGNKTPLECLEEIVKENKLNKGSDTQLYEQIKTGVEQKEFGKAELVQMMKQDPNCLSANIVNKFMTELNILNLYDVQTIVGEQGSRFIKPFLNLQQGMENDPQLRLNKILSKVVIPKGFTEVYFWGLPASGKTCALGGILSVVRSGIQCALEPLPCNASEYMTILSEVFPSFTNTDPARVLPAGTDVTTIAEMLFNLTSIRNPNEAYPLAFIDMAGEICGIMGDEMIGQSLESDKEVVDKVVKMLDKDNKKLHFFVVEYGSENKTYRGKSTAANLTNVQAFIKNHGVFKKGTDCIYVIVTKSDLAQKDAQAAGVSFEKYINDYLMKYYRGFLVGLEALCKEKKLNGGKLEYIYFTMGTVAFKKYCVFDSASSVNVVNKIICQTEPVKKDKLAKLQKSLNF